MWTSHYLVKHDNFMKSVFIFYFWIYIFFPYLSNFLILCSGNLQTRLTISGQNNDANLSDGDVLIFPEMIIYRYDWKKVVTWYMVFNGCSTCLLCCWLPIGWSVFFSSTFWQENLIWNYLLLCNVDLFTLLDFWFNLRALVYWVFFLAVAQIILSIPDWT